MSIEKTLERIADALETIAAGGGSVAAPEPETKKPAKTSKPKPKDNETKVGTDDDDGGITKEEVRAKLQAVQKATTPAQAKSILKAEGATTIGNLAASKYAAVIAACDKILDE